MEYKKWVISLGGSRIIPKEVDYKFIKDFKEVLLSDSDHKFVVVTGGGDTARKYMRALRELNRGTEKQSEAGIAITRFHANYLMRIFGKPANEELPLTIKKVKNLLRKNQVVFCGALRQNQKQTTDGTSASLASELKCPFINITNVKGLYTSDPKINKRAKLIPRISWKDFEVKASKIKFKAGQHFVLDQKAARIIKREKVTTYITGTLKDIKNIINNRRFVGTIIKG